MSGRCLPPNKLSSDLYCGCTCNNLALQKWTVCSGKWHLESEVQDSRQLVTLAGSDLGCYGAHILEKQGKTVADKIQQHK